MEVIMGTEKKPDEWGNIELPGLDDSKLFNTNWNRVAAGLENKHNPKLLAQAQDKKNNPKFSSTMREVAQLRNQNKEYISALADGIANRENTYQAESNSRPEVQEKISKSLKENYTKTEEHLAKVAAKNKERSKPIITPWGEFPSRRSAVIWAHENTNIVNVDKKIQAWVKKPDSGFYYKDVN